MEELEVVPAIESESTLEMQETELAPEEVTSTEIPEAEPIPGAEIPIETLEEEPIPGDEPTIIAREISEINLEEEEKEPELIEHPSLLGEGELLPAIATTGDETDAPRPVEISFDEEPDQEQDISKADTLAEEILESRAESTEDDQSFYIEMPEEPPVSTLKSTRIAQGYTQEEIAERCDIPRDILIKIEDVRYAELPDAGYLRWCITTLAKALELDPREAADEYMRGYRHWDRERL